LDSNDYKSSYKLLDNINDFSKEVKNISNKNFSKIYERKYDDSNKSNESSNIKTDIHTSNTNSLVNSDLMQRGSSNICTISVNKRRIKSAGISRSASNLNAINSPLYERKIHSSHSTQSLNRKKSQSFMNSSTSFNTLYDPAEGSSDKQGIINSNQFKGFVITNDMMKPDFGSSRPTKTPGITIIRISNISI